MTWWLPLAVILVAGAALLLALPASVLFVECIASLVARTPHPRARPIGPSAAILIPAHDEEAGIQHTIESLQRQLRDGDRVLLVADNCSDQTANVARGQGVEVVERVDPDRRGKGYALAFGTDHLAADPPDVVIIVDADCELAEGSIDSLVERALSTRRPVQADYVCTPTERTPISMVSAFAMLIRNRVRPRGLWKLGQPCQLTGTGMAFPWAVLRAAPDLAGHLVEDLAMGTELALMGHEPLLCPEAQVQSDLPSGRGAAMQQRRRWEHGQLGALAEYGPRLIREGIRQRRLSLLVLGADLLVPPLALLVGMMLVVLTLSGVLAWLGGAYFALWVALAAFALVALGVLLGWVRYGREAIPFRYLLTVPVYVLWKLPILATFFSGRRETDWRRTER